jgi:ubiquinone/menaquinone biosynthesis C-methylase UbiE
MGLNHYFSSDPEKRAKFIFNLIAPVYGQLDRAVADGFQKSIQKLTENVDITGKNVLDVGTGTGAWGSLFIEKGASAVTGADFSHKMIKQAKKNHPDMNFIISDGKDLKEIPDKSFDIVTASYVLHGTKQDMRYQILSEMKRVSKEYIVIHDFMGKTHFSIKILEWLERSDFVNFKKTFSREMKTFFPETMDIDVGDGTGLYVGIKK